MKTRWKLQFLLAIAIVLNMVGGMALVVAARQSARYARASNVASEVRFNVLLMAIHTAEMVRARQDEQHVQEAELIHLLRASLARTEGSLSELAGRDETKGALPTRNIPQLRSQLGLFADSYVYFRDAVEGAIEGRSVLRNRDYAFSNSIDLANRMTALIDTCEGHRQRASTRTTLILWFLLAAAVLTMLFIWWMLRRALLQPLADIVEGMRLLSAGELPAEIPMPHESHDEFGELSQYLNAFVERLRKADETKDRFLATMSHEIRTPMNGVIGFLENLESTELNEQQRQYVRVIGSSARALLRVINEILDFSKLTAGKMTLEVVAFDVRKLVEERIAVVRQMVRGKGVRVKLDFPQIDDMVIRGDPVRLRQVLDNLLSNAAKFTQRGEIRLSVTSEAQPDGQLRVSFAVTDTGIGISARDQQQLFNAFTQAETSTTRKFGGTGLGLCIAANLVSLMGSKLRVESQPGEGSAFSFALLTSLARPEEQIQLSDNYTVRLAPGALKKCWALLVDDTPTNLFLMETICQGIGLPYMTAVNGQEAVDKAAKHRFDLIFMDIQMPVMDGYTAIREIRKLENCATTQIIALTASAYQEDVEKALGAGSTGFMAKPFERNQLMLCIAEHLGIPVERELRPMHDGGEAPEELIVRQMYDFMHEQYQISLGEIKRVLAQAVQDWRPLLDDLTVFAKRGDWPPVRAIMHRLKGQLASIGLPTFAETADNVNARIKAGNVDELPPQIGKFVSELGAVFSTVEQEVTLDNRDHHRLGQDPAIPP